MIVDRYYYAQLNKQEQAVYKAFYNGLMAHEDVIPIPIKGQLSKEVFNKIFRAMTRDNPLIYYVNQSACNWATDAFGHTAICPQYFYSRETVRKYNRNIEKAVNNLAAQLKLTEGTEYEKEVVEVDKLVALEKNPKTISKKLIEYFDITKEGEDIQSITKRRRGQEYFRHMILANYGGRCALTGISVPQLLLASHIIPWSDKSHKKERLNPCNGICLSALYDKAFDKGLMTISPDDYSVQLSSALREYESQEYYEKHFGDINGKQITKPMMYEPNREFLAYHRDYVFIGI